MPDMREEFEAWACSQWPGAPVRYVRDALPMDDPRYGEYCSEGLRYAWAAWQASRAALKVELPAKRSYSMYATKHECHAFNDAIEKAAEALQQAGIEVKNG